MEPNTAAADLEYISSVIKRTQKRIDPHAFHFVLWGAIVLVCYPLLNYFQNTENLTGFNFGLEAVV